MCVPEHPADGAFEYRAGAAEGDVADELLPYELVDVLEALDVEPGLAPHAADPLQPVGDPAPELPEPDELHAVVVRVPGPADGGPEAARDAQQHVVRGQVPADPLPRAQPVLDREHEGAAVQQRPDGGGGRGDPVRLGRDDHEVAGPGLGRIRGRMEPYPAIAARPLDPQPPGAYRIDVLAPRIDRPDFVPGRGEQARVHRAHRPGADHRDLHLHALPFVEVPATPAKSGHVSQAVGITSFVIGTAPSTPRALRTPRATSRRAIRRAC